VNLSTLLLILVVFFLITPMIQRFATNYQRVRAIRRLEEKHGSRVVTLIHRQEPISLLGLPISRYIDVDDSEAILRAVRLTPDELPMDLVVHTPGGLVLAAEQIAEALVRRKGRVTVFVPHYAMSGGSLIAMAADEIVMDENAVLGPVDPQVGQYPAASILNVVEQKPISEVDDQTLILADVGRKALEQVRATVVQVLTGNVADKKAQELATALASGRWTHDYPISFEEAKALGLPVSDAIPKEVHELMSLYPQAPSRRPSVQYIPIPYGPQQPRRDQQDERTPR
jgi:ClpP class serine protease